MLPNFHPESCTLHALLNSCPTFEGHLDSLARNAATRMLGGVIQLRDFALEADGGSIDYSVTTGGRVWSFGSMAPEVAIQEPFRVGQCWKVVGSTAQLGLSLAEPIYPTNVTIKHIPHYSAADIGQAPQNITLWGVVEGAANIRIVEQLQNDGVISASDLVGPSIRGEYHYIRIADFRYTVPSDFHLQTFEVSHHILTSMLKFGIIVVEVHSNWGSVSTCVYRVMIHGLRSS